MRGLQAVARTLYRDSAEDAADLIRLSVPWNLWPTHVLGAANRARVPLDVLSFHEPWLGFDALWSLMLHWDDRKRAWTNRRASIRPFRKRYWCWPQGRNQLSVDGSRNWGVWTRFKASCHMPCFDQFPLMSEGSTAEAALDRIVIMDHAYCDGVAGSIEPRVVIQLRARRW